MPDLSAKVYFSLANKIKIYNWLVKHFDLENLLSILVFDDNGSVIETLDTFHLTRWPSLLNSYEQFEKSSFDNSIILSGTFYKKENMYAQPTFYGNYLIKLDENFEEEYRVIFNEELDFFPETRLLSILDSNKFLFLDLYSGLTLYMLEIDPDSLKNFRSFEYN